MGGSHFLLLVVKVDLKMKVKLYGIKISIPFVYEDTLKAIIDMAKAPKDSAPAAAAAAGKVMSVFVASAIFFSAPPCTRENNFPVGVQKKTEFSYAASAFLPPVP